MVRDGNTVQCNLLTFYVRQSIVLEFETANDVV